MKTPPLNITQGPWRIEGQHIFGNDINGYICTWSGNRSDAEFIIESANVATDTGLSPKMVQEQKGKADDLLKEILKDEGFSQLRSINKEMIELYLQSIQKGGANG